MLRQHNWLLHFGLLLTFSQRNSIDEIFFADYNHLLLFFIIILDMTKFFGIIPVPFVIPSFFSFKHNNHQIFIVSKTFISPQCLQRIMYFVSIGSETSSWPCVIFVPVSKICFFSNTSHECQQPVNRNWNSLIIVLSPHKTKCIWDHQKTQTQ